LNGGAAETRIPLAKALPKPGNKKHQRGIVDDGSIDNRCEDRKKKGELRGDILAPY
jgi:hypothetical protein